jgi:hypothetical protein
MTILIQMNTGSVDREFQRKLEWSRELLGKEENSSNLNIVTYSEILI